jgi:outer membrane autotransporter protein
LDYQPNQVLLEAIQGSFASVEGLTPNERAVARGLDKVVENSHVSKLVDTLDSLPIGAIPNALERIVPTDLLTMFDASLASSEVQANNLERRMEELRNGATGFSASGLNVSDPHGTRSFNGNTDGKQAIDKDGKTLEPAPVDNRWGFFINGSGEFVDTESTSIARGTDFTTEGITTGADYRLGDHAAVGVTAGYANTSNDGLGNGAVKIDSGKLGLYGTVFSDGFFLNSVLGGGLNSYDTRRDTLGGNARGDTDGTDYNALLGTGYTYRKGGLSVGPIASLRYSSVGIDSFTERGSLAPLKISEQSEDSLKSTAGMQASYAFLLGKTTVTPQIRAQWKHEYLDTARGIAASFLPGGSFTVYGPETGRDSLLLDVGATVQLTQTVGVFLYYNGDIGGENYTSHAVNGGVQVSF